MLTVTFNKKKYFTCFSHDFLTSINFLCSIVFLSASLIFHVLICWCHDLQDLSFLAEGLEGRSPNPVALLFDALCRPDADLGVDNPSLLEWKFEKEHAIDHVVLGKGKAGGAWQVKYILLIYMYIILRIKGKIILNKKFRDMVNCSEGKQIEDITLVRVNLPMFS